MQILVLNARALLEVLGGLGGSGKAPRAPGRLREGSGKVPGGSGGLREPLGGAGRLRGALGGCGRLWEAPGGSGELHGVAGGSRDVRRGAVAAGFVQKCIESGRRYVCRYIENILIGGPKGDPSGN